MPLPNFYGKTFVAFSDISGFKQMMKNGKAIQAMDKFYNAGYTTIQYFDMINGLFISDSGILFVNQHEDPLNGLIQLLSAVKNINSAMLNYDFMLTTSIAYGEFSYHNRMEMQGIEKAPIYGEGYVKAFLDNETGKPKLQPGQCRIILNDDLNLLLNEQAVENIKSHRLFLRYKNNNKHLQFFWNVENEQQIEYFEQSYNDSYNAKYAGMLNALKNL